MNPPLVSVEHEAVCGFHAVEDPTVLRTHSRGPCVLQGRRVKERREEENGKGRNRCKFRR